MAVIELADNRYVTLSENGNVRAGATYRVDGGVTATPPVGIAQIPERGSPHPTYQAAIVRSIEWKPVSDYGWEASVTWSNVDYGNMGPIIPEELDIGKYRFGLAAVETEVQCPVSRLTRKAMPAQNGQPETTVNFYETIIQKIPQGALKFSVEVVSWAPGIEQTLVIADQISKIHKFSGPNELRFRLLGADTEYLGQRGEGTDPVMRNVVRYRYNWIEDGGTTLGVDGIRNGPDMYTPRNADGEFLPRPPFGQWVILPKPNPAEPPAFDVLKPYTEDLEGWRQLPGMEYVDGL